MLIPAGVNICDLSCIEKAANDLSNLKTGGKHLPGQSMETASL